MSRKIFISYRRKHDGAGFALALHARLQELIGAKHVFLDTAETAIALGDDWKQQLTAAVRGSTAVLVVIDNQWIMRLGQKDDAVRFEIETALQAGKRVIPVLVAGARMPPAEDLPESLKQLPQLQAHEIRTSTAPSDTDRLILKLVGRTDHEPGAGPDRVDLATAGGLSLLAALAWLSWGRVRFNLPETWLWGSSVALLTLLVFNVRRIASAFRMQWSAPSRNRAVANVIVAFIGISAFAGAAWNVYRVPVFAGNESGLLIARFAGDPADEYQRSVEAEMQHAIGEQRLAGSGVVIQTLPRLVHDDLTARRFGALARATAVLWGKPSEHLPRTGGDDGLRVTFIRTEGIFNPTDVQVEKGAFFERPPRDLRISGDETLLYKALPPLIAGYRLYRENNSDDNAYTRSLEYFDHALRLLTDTRLTNSSHEVSDAKATLNFYRGNVYFRRRDASNAELAFRTAMDQIPRPFEPFIEPANNLGVLLLEQQRFEDARTALNKVDLECSPQGTSQPLNPVCAYVRYNLGSIYRDMERFEDAEKQFANTIQIINNLPAAKSESADQKLLALTHQNIAYGLVMLGFDQPARENRVRFANEAQQQWKQGLAVLDRNNMQPPDRVGVTLARIHVLRAEWKQAVDVLSHLETSKLHEPDVYLLLAIAHQCGGNPELVGRDFARFIDQVKPDRTRAARGSDRLDAETKRCSNETKANQ